jgi:A/G-specific adenine glycosylase
MKDTLNENAPFLSEIMWVRLRSWHHEYGRQHLPWRGQVGPWGVLLAEILLHRTRADAVEKLYPSVIREFSSPADVLAKRQRWIEATRSLGLFWRTQQFVLACEMLVEEHGGTIPSDEGVLLRLPGVGHYIASAVRCFGFAIPAVIVDTNTIRLTSRISGQTLEPSRHRSKDVHKMVARLGEDTNPPNAEDNYSLLDIASLVCLIQDPLHSECPLLPCCATGRAYYPLESEEK